METSINGKQNAKKVFMHSLNHEEAEFHKYFASFEAIESGYWQATVDATISVLHDDQDYADYPADRKRL